MNDLSLQTPFISNLLQAAGLVGSLAICLFGLVAML